MKQFKYNTDNGELEVKEIKAKRLSAIIKAVEVGAPQEDIDRFIALYLPTTDSEQIAAEQWYKYHQLVLTLNPNEVITKTSKDEDGNEVIETLENDHAKALAARTALELEHEWLKGLLGEDAPERPAFNVDVAQFKMDNTELFDSFNKLQGAEINGHKISLNESNQNGLAAVLTGVNLAISFAQNPFPINFKAETPTGSVSLPFIDLESLNLFALQFISARQEFFK